MKANNTYRLPDAVATDASPRFDSEIRQLSPRRAAPDQLLCVLSSRSFLHFKNASETFWGMVLFAHPTEDDMRVLVQSLVTEVEPHVVPHVSVVDASRMKSVDAGAFEVLCGHVRERFDDLRVHVRALGLVRPTGLPGAVISGMFDVLRRPYPVSVFDRLEDSITWLGAREASVRGQEEALSASITELVETFSDPEPMLTAVRTMLMRQTPPTIEAAAASLKVSPRALQRRLSKAGTSLRQEIRKARLRTVQRLLTHTNLPIKEIAVEAGLSSAQHLSVAFRRLTGESPSSWRQVRRLGNL